MRCRLLVPALLSCTLFASFAASVRAQSLADVARQEQERRQAVKEPGKTYTNKDLPAVSHAALPPGDRAGQAAADTAASSDSGDKDKDKKDVGTKDATGKGKDDTKTADKPKDQKYWSERMTALRTTLSRDQMYADALQSRINALTTDFVNRDDPAQRAVIGQDRQKALDELGRLKDVIGKDRQAITDAEEEARRSNVPQGWLR
jgi:hypothetical protein